MSHPLFEIVTTTAGVLSIRNKALNETMHNPVGPWAEANALYVDQCRLHDRLSRADQLEPLVLFDVGLGAAANALAALACARSHPSPRALKIVSFERDLELLRFALAHADAFAHFAGWVEAIERLLAEGAWQGGSISWELREGDFLKSIATERERPHLIFFDPYSPKVNDEMWSIACFQALRRVARNDDEGGCVLYTYSQATPVRVALLLAGFNVGRGGATGLKEETTQAATSLAQLTDPLASEWLRRWGRSGSQLPYGGLAAAPLAAQKSLAAWLESHAQLGSGRPT